MDMNVFNDLYKRVAQIRVNTCPPSALSGLLHGYLSVCSIVRVYPWLEEDYGTWWDNYLKIQEIARELEKLVRDETLPFDERAGYVVDLLDAYQTFDDMSYVDLGVEVAYVLQASEDVKNAIAFGGTPNLCRSLCYCFYFTGDKECKEVVVEMIKGWVEEGRKTGKYSRKRWKAISFYEDVVSDNEGFCLEEEREQLMACNVRVEDEIINEYRSDVQGADVYLSANVFRLLAERAFVGYARS